MPLYPLRNDWENAFIANIDAAVKQEANTLQLIFNSSTADQPT